MNRKGKSWPLFVVAILIVLFSLTAILGVSYTYGDTKNVYVKGASDIRFGIDIRGGVDVTFMPADDVEVTLELPESYVLGSDPEVYAVYTVHGGEKQESTSVRVDAEISGLPELLENSTGQELEAAKAVKPQSHAFWLLGISLGSTAAAALVTFLVVRFITWRKKRRRTRTEQGQTRRGK